MADGTVEEGDGNGAKQGSREDDMPEDGQEETIETATPSWPGRRPQARWGMSKPFQSYTSNSFKAVGDKAHGDETIATGHDDAEPRKHEHSQKQDTRNQWSRPRPRPAWDLSRTFDGKAMEERYLEKRAKKRAARTARDSKDDSDEKSAERPKTLGKDGQDDAEQDGQRRSLELSHQNAQQSSRTGRNEDSGHSRTDEQISSEAPQTNRGSRGIERKESGNPEGQVGGGPAGHHGSPVRGKPTGETGGGPAADAALASDADEHGNTNFIEQQFSRPTEGSPAEHRGSKVKQDEECDGEASEHDSGDEFDEEEGFPNWWFGVRRKLREPLSEFLATMIYILVGICGNLQVITSQYQYGTFGQQCAVWGLGIMMAIYIGGGISGAHCNPMVSINLCIFRGFPLHKVWTYLAAQYAGAFVAVFIAFGIYRNAILSIDPQLTTSTSQGTGRGFYTLPQSFASPATSFFNDFTAAAVMSGTTLALGDDTNAPPGAGMHAFILALVSYVICAVFGYNSGPQNNPAKDLASRVITWWMGYGSEMWSKTWWAEAWAAAISGGLFGCLVYDVLIYEGRESPVNFPRGSKRKDVTSSLRERLSGAWLSFWSASSWRNGINSFFGTVNGRGVSNGDLESGASGEELCKSSRR